MQNLQVVISPKELSYNNRNRPLQILFKYKRILISTDYELQKFQAKSKLTLKNNHLYDISSVSDQRDPIAIRFNLCKQMEILNTKIQVIMIGCQKSEVNLLGICEIDLGLFVESQATVKVQKMKTKKYRLQKCEDQNAYLTVNVGFNTIIPQQNHRQNKHSNEMGILQTQGYKRQSFLLNRRRNKEIPTAYEISHRNYKKVEITREQFNELSHSRSQKKSIGSYKKRFDYHYQKNEEEFSDRSHVYEKREMQKKEKTTYHKQQANRNSPMPRMKTPQPLTQNNLSKQSPSIDDRTQKKSKNPQSKNNVQKQRNPHHKIANQSIIKEYNERCGRGLQTNSQNLTQMSPNSDKNNKFQMITEKLKQIQMKITGNRADKSAPVTYRSHNNPQSSPNEVFTEIEQPKQFSYNDFLEEDEPRKPKSPIKHKQVKQFQSQSEQYVERREPLDLETHGQDKQSRKSDQSGLNSSHSNQQLSSQNSSEIVSEVMHYCPPDNSKKQIVYESEVIQINPANSHKQELIRAVKRENNGDFKRKNNKEQKQIQKVEDPKQESNNSQLQMIRTQLLKQFQVQAKIKEDNHKLQCQAYTNRIKQFETDIKEYQKKQKQLEDKHKLQYQAYNDRIKQYEADLNEYQKIIAENKKQLNEQNTKQKHPGNDPSALIKKENKKMQERINSLEAALDEQEENYRKMSLEKELEFKQTIKEKENERQIYRDEIEKYRTENIRQKQLIDKLNQINQEADDQHFEELKENQKKCLDYSRKLEQANREYSNLLQKVSEQQKQIQQLQDIINLRQYEMPGEDESNKKIKLLSSKLELSEQQQINLENKLRIKENQHKFMKIQMDNLKQERKDLENEIDMIAINNKHELGRQGSINRLNLESKSMFVGVQNQNRVLKSEIGNLRNQVRQLNQLLEAVIKKDSETNSKIRQLENQNTKRMKQDYQSLVQRYQSLQNKLQIYEQQITKKQNTIGEILNLIWKYGNEEIINEINDQLGQL